MNLLFFRKKAHRELNFKKITRYAIIINTFQIVAALGIALYAALSGSFNLSGRVERILIMSRRWWFPGARCWIFATPIPPGTPLASGKCWRTLIASWRP